MRMPFGLGKEIAVLEGKFEIYENLSKEMLDKLERAVEKISEGNQKVALILAKHEEKIEQGIRADELILKMVEEMRAANSKEHEAVIERLDGLESRVDEFSKFRWLAIGIATAATVIITSAGFFGNLLTMGNHGAIIHGGNPAQVK
jgi:hypothetical protein